MVRYNIEFTWPDYKKYSGQTDAPTIERAVANLLFRGRNKGGMSRLDTSGVLEKILKEHAYIDLDEFPIPEKRQIVQKPLPPMDEDGDVTGSMKACVAAIKEALGSNQTVQEIGEDVGLPVDRELAIPYDQGKAKPDGDDRHNHFFKDVNEVQDPFQF